MSGIPYTARVENTALSTSNDTATFVAASTRCLLIQAVSLYGLGTSSAANSVKICRSTGGTTGGGAVTPAPLNPSSPAAACTVNTTWSTQPTLGAVIRNIGVNANGAVVRMPINATIQGSGQCSIRSGTGTSNVNLDVEFLEF